MVCAHHEFGAGKYLPVPLVWEAYPDDLFRGSPMARSLVGQYLNSLLACLFSPAASKTLIYSNNIVVALSLGVIYAGYSFTLLVSLAFENFPDLENNTLKWG
jgi:hypothetical protein